MLVTSNEANKILKTYESELYTLCEIERVSKYFTASTTENIEDVRPDYDFGKTQEDIMALQEKIRTVKHAINAFNVNTEVPGTLMTIDQILVFMPQTNQTLSKLSEMQHMLPKHRSSNNRFSGNNAIEYDYTNYDTDEARLAFNNLRDYLNKVQTELDKVNNTIKFEIDI